MVKNWNGTQGTKTEARQCAIAVSRSQLRRVGIDPKTATMREYELALDEVARVNPGNPGSVWYGEAEWNRAEWGIFQTEVRKWQKRGW